MDQQQWQEFLTQQGALWEGDAAHFAPSNSDGQASLHLADLSPLGALSVSGPDSQKFLQGQLTCDLVNLPDLHATLGAHCNPKGRMISAFHALKIDHGEFVLRLPRDLVDTARTALAKYAVFFKTKLDNVNAGNRWLGLFGRGAAERAVELLGLDRQLAAGAVATFDCGGERALAHAISDDQVALMVPATQAAELWQTLADKASPSSYSRWQEMAIDAGIPQLHAATSEEFIPQMLNLHLLHGVSFKKGCYTGQEVVARMQYLGAAKRRMFRVRLPQGEVPQPGTEIYAGGEQSVGNLVEACRGSRGLEALAVLSKSHVVAGDTLKLSDGRALELLELPYDADADPLA